MNIAPLDSSTAVAVLQNIQDFILSSGFSLLELDFDVEFGSRDLGVKLKKGPTTIVLLLHDLIWHARVHHADLEEDSTMDDKDEWTGRDAALDMAISQALAPLRSRAQQILNDLTVSKT